MTDCSTALLDALSAWLALEESALLESGAEAPAKPLESAFATEDGAETEALELLSAVQAANKLPAHAMATIIANIFLKYLIFMRMLLYMLGRKWD
ncbi:MAG: hypothetical protein GXY32_00695 [Ruminococcaceae bacterium]|nr:hypothetical protein [Oscillospiraceae bacterium]